jgi:drug/metabolite transporter (DMT)-like permease
LVIYAPIYLALHGIHLAETPVVYLTIQVIFQGIVVTIISPVLYGRAVVILGASGGSAFGALVPALSAVLAVPLLGEWPNTSAWGRHSPHIGWYIWRVEDRCRY